MSENVIATATTDVVPALAHRVVVRSAMTWTTGQDSLAGALEGMVDWARDNGYHAVVGVRFEATTTVAPAASAVVLTRMNDERTIRGEIAAGSASVVRYVGYGTAVEYAPE